MKDLVVHGVTMKELLGRERALIGHGDGVYFPVFGWIFQLHSYINIEVSIQEMKRLWKSLKEVERR